MTRATKASRLRVTLLIAGGLVASWATCAAWLAYQAGRDNPARFEKKVRELEASRTNSDTGAVVLTGSSFFERWVSSTADLAPLHTVNIGIGGTKIGDHLHYFDRMVEPLRPTALVVYAGSNDISGIPFLTKSAEPVVEQVLRYLRRAQDAFPNVPLFYVAITETPSRRRVRAEIQRANRLLAAAAESAGFHFIDTAPKLLTGAGDIDGSLFGPDRLHFNERGYERFSSCIRHDLIEALGAGQRPDGARSTQGFADD